MIGQKFGRLIVLEYHGVDKNHHKIFKCQCECGSFKNIRATSLKKGTKSCGCITKDILNVRNYKHGHKSRDERSATYTTWVSMIQRCTNPKHTFYRLYGGRGIKVCDRWLVFENFLHDMGTRPDGMTIGRKHHNDNYSVETCKWESDEDQSNSRTTNRLLHYKNEDKTIAEWARLFEISPNTIYHRLRRNWSVEKALETPANKSTKIMTQLTKEEMSKIGKSNSLKGKTLERRVSRLITEWSGVEFRRRRVEGRDANVIERESTADIISVNVPINLSIEVKSGAGFSLDAILANPTKTKFCSWWHQSSYDAMLMTNLLKTKIYPFLFFKPSRVWDWVAFPISYYHILKFNDGITTFPHLQFKAFDDMVPVEYNISASKKNPIMFALQLESCVICRWKDFADNVKPETIFLQPTTKLEDMPVNDPSKL